MEPSSEFPQKSHSLTEPRKRRDSEVLLISIKVMLREFFTNTKVWHMVPNCTELLILSQSLTVQNVIDIFSENDANFCLLIDQEKNSLTALILVADFINFLISLKPETGKPIEEDKDTINYLKSTSIWTFLQTHKKYTNRPIDEIIHREVNL